MEMTIDKAIPKIQFVRNSLNDDMGIAKAYDLAINTMRKYQKIAQIIDDWNNDKINNIICCLDIEEVVEDGKID